MYVTKISQYFLMVCYKCRWCCNALSKVWCSFGKIKALRFISFGLYGMLLLLLDLTKTKQVSNVGAVMQDYKVSCKVFDPSSFRPLSFLWILFISAFLVFTAEKLLPCVNLCQIRPEQGGDFMIFHLCESENCTWSLEATWAN